MLLIFAFLPLLVALLLFMVLRQSSPRAGVVTLATTLLIIIDVAPYHVSGSTLVTALEKGGSTAATVLGIILPGFWLYHLLRESGGLRSVATLLLRHFPERDLALLLLILGLEPFIEAVSGFGLGIVVVVPILLALGYDALQAALLALLGQLTTAWGALGVATFLGAKLTGLLPDQLAAHSAVLLAPLPVGFALLALFIAGSHEAVRRSWLPAVFAGSVLALGEWGWSQFPGVALAGLLSSLGVVLFLFLWNQLAIKMSLRGESGAAMVMAAAPGETTTLPLSLWRVLGPYLLLSLGLLAAQVLMPFLPGFAHVAFLASPATWLTGASLLAIFTWRLDKKQWWNASTQTVQRFVPSAIAITSFLLVAALMEASGMTAAIGVAASALGPRFVWVSPWLGAVSGWITGSNLGGNAMFAPLQQATARHLSLSVGWLVAAQNAATTLGRLLSPAILVLCSSTANLTGGEGRLVRKLGVVVLAAICAIGLLLVGLVSFSLIVPLGLGLLLLSIWWFVPHVLDVSHGASIRTAEPAFALTIQKATRRIAHIMPAHTGKPALLQTTGTLSHEKPLTSALGPTSRNDRNRSR